LYLPPWPGGASLFTQLANAASKSLKKAGFTGPSYKGFYIVTHVDSTRYTVEFAVYGHSRSQLRPGFSMQPNQASEGQLFETRVHSLLRELREREGEIVSRAMGVPLDVHATWAPSSGLCVATAQTQPADLRQRATGQQRRQRRLSRMAWIMAAGAVALLTLLLILSLSGDASYYGLVALYPSLFLLGALTFRSMAREASLDARSLSDEADVSELVLHDEERRAQKQLQIHSHELERYYELALRQRAYIFSVGVLCILAGFGAVAAAFLLLADDSIAPETSDKVVVASLGVVSGILANFVAVVFLRMFAATVESMTVFHTRLVRTHHVHIGNFLAAKVRDAEARDRLLAEMAHVLAADTGSRERASDEAVNVP
jgi:hypothetical protein